mgnify:CR=1 FL=1
MLVLLIVALGPIFAVGLIFWPSITATTTSAATVAMFATALVGWLNGIQFPAIYIAAVVGIVATGASPLASAIIVAAVAIAMGLYGSAGLAIVAVQIATSIPFVVAEPPEVSSAGGYLQLIVGLTVASTWGIFLGWLVRRFVPMAEPPRQGVQWIPGVVAGLSLAAVGGSVTYYSQVSLAGTMWAWVLLTFFMLVKPDSTFNLPKISQRVAGTLVGSALATIVIVSGLPITLQPILVIVLLAVALTILVSGKPYWMFVTTLTPAVILMHTGKENPLSVLEERIGYTLVGAVLAIALGVLINFMIDKLPKSADQN